MPWKVTSVMQQRYDMVQELLDRTKPARAIFAKYRISAKTGYKWLERYQLFGAEGLGDRSRRPQRSPNATPADVTAQVVALREQHPRWGSKKIHALLPCEGGKPCERTVHRLIKNAGLIAPVNREPAAVERFERGQPNELWQLDFKSPVWLYEPTGRTRLQPLSVLDDHSRFALGLVALPNQQLLHLWPALWDVFGAYGLPEAILTDNANGLFRSHRDGITSFTMRLWRLGIRHLHGRPYHPQTQGKVERWHRTLDDEALSGQRYDSLPALQQALEDFRNTYNHVRPHEALNLQPPRSRYAPSVRQRPAALPEIDYPPGAILRTVTAKGYISVRGCRVRVGEGLAGERVQLLEHETELVIQYSQFRVRQVPWDELKSGQWL